MVHVVLAIVSLTMGTAIGWLGWKGLKGSKGPKAAERTVDAAGGSESADRDRTAIGASTASGE
jgi:hypothetical protein